MSTRPILVTGALIAAGTLGILWWSKAPARDSGQGIDPRSDSRVTEHVLAPAPVTDSPGHDEQLQGVVGALAAVPPSMRSEGQPAQMKAVPVEEVAPDHAAGSATEVPTPADLGTLNPLFGGDQEFETRHMTANTQMRALRLAQIEAAIDQLPASPSEQPQARYYEALKTEANWLRANPKN
jgi:hypothetical protein